LHTFPPSQIQPKNHAFPTGLTPYTLRGYTDVAPMKLLTRIVISALVFGLLVGPEPTQGLCPMAQKISAASCAMPCCKTSRAKASQCPMIRPAQDTIALAALRLPTEWDTEVVPVFQSAVRISTPDEVFKAVEFVPRIDFCSTPQSIPAPPSHA
jgi:hypothetical protein